MSKLFNLARMSTATTGTGTITLGTNASGHLSFANAGVSDGDYVTYGIIDGTESEVGRGLYTASGTTLTRNVITSTNSNTAINLSGTAEVFITGIAEDFNALSNTSGQYTVNLAAGTNVTANRTLTLTTGDANRTIDISAGNVTISTAGAALIDDADAAAQRTTLGLGTMAVETASDYLTTAAASAGYQPLDAQLTDVAGLTPTDSNFIVGNGTNFVTESGATARTSLGLGTGDSPQFTAVNIGDAADTTLTRVSAGVIAVEGDTVAMLSATQTLANKTLTTPNIGTPSAGTLTNCTGLPVATGIGGLGSNVATFLATPSSANLAAALTDETGTGAAVFGTTPTFSDAITVRSADTGANAAPDVILYRDSASPADDDVIGQIKFDGEDSAGNQQTYGRITGQILDEASTSEDGAILFGVVTAGTLANEVRLDGAALSPVTSDGNALGTSSLMWSDLFLASGGVVNFNNGDVTLTHSADTLTMAGGNLSLGTTASLTTGTIELGHASDTTISRSSAGNIAVEGNVVYRAGGTDVALADGGTGASLADPNADRIMFWDDSAGAVTWLTPNAGMAIDGTNLNVNGALRSVQVFTASGTWTRPAGVTQVIVEVIGGGGGGGGVENAASLKVSAAGGGGGGGYAIKLVTTPGATETVTIGAGGAGGAAGQNNGATGATTSFGSHVSATGGDGGVYGISSNSAGEWGASGGTGGSGSGGTLNIGGQPGQLAIYSTATNGLVISSGAGGIAGRGGGGGRSRPSTFAGESGSAPGGGGSGAVSYTQQGARAGGNGAAGICIVWEYS